MLAMSSSQAPEVPTEENNEDESPNSTSSTSEPEPDPEVRQPETEIRQPETVIHQPETEIRQPETKIHQPETEIHQPETEIRQPETEIQQPETEIRQPETEIHQPKTEIQQPKTEIQQPETEIHQPETEIQQPETEIQQPETEIQQPETEIHQPETEIRQRRNAGNQEEDLLNFSNKESNDQSRLDKVKQYVADTVAHADEQIEEMMEQFVNKAESVCHDANDIVHNAIDKLKDWSAIEFNSLPTWMKDNDFLHFGHRPELPSFAECFKSIFRIHTETGNIWTHLIGFIGFIVITVIFYVKPFCDNCNMEIHLSDKLIFLFFFLGAILCLACSTLFHTLACHSPEISSFYSRLDYCGIALLIVGSVIPWLYYGFYCSFYTKLTYMIIVGLMGVATMVVVMWEKFNQPEYRPFRAGVFVSLALLSALPTLHFIGQYGLKESMKQASLHYMLIMGALYLTGALLYATRVPERFLPGKCDIWFQSHQIFHVFVVAAAFVHYHGITEMAMHRLTHGERCTSPVVASLAPGSVYE